MDAFTQRIADSKAGIFSIDHNVARRELHAKIKVYTDRVAAAYVALGVDQRAIYRTIEAQVAAELGGSGVWPKSSGRYDELRAYADGMMLRRNALLGGMLARADALVGTESFL